MSANPGTGQTGEEKKNVTVQIFGNEYPIAGVKDPHYVEELARYLDGKMKDIARGSTLLSSGKFAVLAALNIADELHFLRAGHQRLKEHALSGLSSIQKKIDEQLQR